jgi:hypothetical protein
MYLLIRKYHWIASCEGKHLDSLPPSKSNMAGIQRGTKPGFAKQKNAIHPFMLPAPGFSQMANLSTNINTNRMAAIEHSGHAN